MYKLFIYRDAQQKIKQQTKNKKQNEKQMYNKESCRPLILNLT